MPQRAMNLILAVLGLLAVAGLLLAGADIYRAARTGPGWKRRLVTAGLFLLAMLGVTSCEKKDRPVCYRPMILPPARQSLERLPQQLSLLDEFARESLRADAVYKTLEAIERDIATLADDRRLAELPEAERVQATELRDAAKAKVREVRRRLRTLRGGIEETNEWKAIAEAWKGAAPLAESGRSTTAQREFAKKKLKGAHQAVQRLAVLGLLTEAEMGLLVSEAERLRKDIYRNPPTDCKVTCYDMEFIPPRLQSLERLSQRLPLLKKLAAEGSVHPAVLEKIVPSIEADLKTLSDERSLKEARTPREVAEKLRREAQATLDEIRALLKGK